MIVSPLQFAKEFIFIHPSIIHPCSLDCVLNEGCVCCVCVWHVWLLGVIRVVLVSLSEENRWCIEEVVWRELPSSALLLGAFSLWLVLVTAELFRQAVRALPLWLPHSCDIDSCLLRHDDALHVCWWSCCCSHAVRVLLMQHTFKCIVSCLTSL